MTTLHTNLTTPPPRLPVRDKAATRQRAWGGVSPMLARLAGERATGVLVRECGSLYLADGQVVHADSPAVPGLDVLLTARGTLDAQGWRDAVGAAGGRNRVGRFLVESGRIGAGALEVCHLGALYDAAYFALAPSVTPGHFRYGDTHWLGPVRPVPVAAVEHETLRRRALLHRIWPDPAPDSAPLLHSGSPAAPSVSARQHAVLALVDGVRTAADIALALARPTFHALVDIRRLAAAGVIAPAAAPAPLPDPSPPPPVSAAPQAPPAPPGTLPPSFADPNITLLKRLRDALEAL
ncbi:transcriptional regulator [Streptomyces sp. ME02-8801-2C]|uniref:transcriptional regulator n=1 Tax=Streptomyces sp. ME02-8801-2C TaxID=3028680 RepID=UPI00299F9BC0|nr:transcriptional regulator [Streptomyces sp. ME02-8801-2C]MDX3457747.1 transcriptional regulator [Streptomyces sp. ME02-8801-2C]